MPKKPCLIGFFGVLLIFISAIDFRSANQAEISSFCKECDAEYSCDLHLRFKTNGL